MPNMCDFAKFLKWYDFEAIFYSNTGFAALHYATSYENGYQSVIARPRIWSRIDIVALIAPNCYGRVIDNERYENLCE